MMKRSISLWLAIVIIILSLTGITAFAAEDTFSLTGTVNTSSLHMRSSASTEGSIIRDYKKGTQVTILENDGNWCYVSVGDLSGYMMTKYLNITSNLPHLYWGRTEDNAAVLSIYTEPNENSAVKTRFFSGAVVDIIERSSDQWYKVRLNEQVGYLPVSNITETFSGEYNISTFSTSLSPYSLSEAAFSAGTKEYGDEITINGMQGCVEYTFTYPVTAIGAADATISAWLKKLRKNAPQVEGAAITVDYSAVMADDRYAGIVLMAEYKDSVSSCTTLTAFNIDTQSGTLLTGTDFINNISRVCLILESRISRFFLTASEGYEVKPDASWLSDAVITEDGISVYLPAGKCLPASLGSQCISMTYRELSGYLSLDSELATQSYIDPTKPMVCLTFDDGPSEYTAKLLDLLQEYNGHATFCVQGIRVGDYPSTIKRMAAEGHEIASHTYSHKKLTTLSASNARYQISQVEVEVNKIIDYDIKWLRCPYGSNSKTVRSICADLDMSIAYWQIDTLDWSTKNAQKTFSTIKKELKSGDIVLCHDLYEETYEAMLLTIPWLAEQGYQMVTLSEMFQFYEGGIKTGTTYFRMTDENNSALVHAGEQTNK